MYSCKGVLGLVEMVKNVSEGKHIFLELMLEFAHARGWKKPAGAELSKAQIKLDYFCLATQKPEMSFIFLDHHTSF